MKALQEEKARIEQERLEAEAIANENERIRLEEEFAIAEAKRIKYEKEQEIERLKREMEADLKREVYLRYLKS